MTQLPEETNRFDPARRRHYLGLLFRVLFVLSVLLTGAIGIGTWWLWRYAQTDLTPDVEKQVGKILKRPVELGEVEQVTPFSITFGPSAIPTTESDSDEVRAQSVDVNFNPLQLLLTGGTLDLNVTLVDPDVYLEQDADGEWVNPELDLPEGSGPLKIGLKTLKLRRGNVRAVPFWEEEGRPAEPVDLQGVEGQLVIQEGGEKLKFDADGQVVGQTGRVKTSGEALTTNPRIELAIKGKDLLISDVKELLEKTVPLPVVEFGQGRIDADIDIGFVPGDPNVEIEGEATFREVTAKVPQLPLPVQNAKGKVTIKDNDIQVLKASGNYGNLELETQGQVHLVEGLNMTAQVKPLPANEALETAQVELPVVVTGLAAAEDLRVTGQADSPIITGRVKAAQTLMVDKVPFQEASSRFEFKDSVLSLEEIRAVPASGGLITGNGQIILGEPGRIAIKTQATNLDGDALLQLYNSSELPVELGQLRAQANVSGPLDRPFTKVEFQALEADYPARGSATISDNIVRVDELLLRVAEGTVRGVGKLEGDRWAGTASLSGVRLNQFSPDLRGELSGNVSLGGPVQAFSPAVLDARGKVTFSEGIALVEEPLTADFRWDGSTSQIAIAEASAPGLNASGRVKVDTETLAIAAMNLDVSARGYDLRSLPLASEDLPVAADLNGFANFDGKITGSLETLKAQGDLAIRQFQLNNLPFESSLDGEVSYSPQGTRLVLAGQRDRIDFDLDPEFMPKTFLVRQGEAIARGQRSGPDQYDINLDEFNLAALNIQPNPGLGNVPLEGLASGRATVNLTPLTAQGELVVVEPTLGTLKGTQLTSRFSLENNLVKLTNTALVQELCRFQRGPNCSDSVETRYELTKGEILLGEDPSFDVAIAIQNGDTQGLLRMVQWFEFGDVAQGLNRPIYGSSADLSLTSLGEPKNSLLNQLRRFSEVQQLILQEEIRRQTETRIPPLIALSGQFGGSIKAKGSLNGGLKSSFNIEGQNWSWGRYDVDSVEIGGEFNDGILTLLPVRVTDDEAVVTFSGQLGGEQQAGELRAEKVPVGLARNFIDLPVDLAGELTLQANLSGSAENPQAIGSINLQNGSLNGTPVQTERVGFNYVDARLRFGGILGVAPPEPVRPETSDSNVESSSSPSSQPTQNVSPGGIVEPLRISGSIPYAVPFSKVQPSSDELSLSLRVQNQGLAFLNLLTRDQIQWVDGQGEIQLDIGGTLSNPIAQGVATFKDATLAAQVFPDEPLTGVTGLINFDQNQIRTPTGIRGNFSKGTVLVKGALPLSTPEPVTEPLLAQFRDLNLNLRGLYRGEASGDVTIRGSALRPDLAGAIVLRRGQVLLPEPSTAAAQTLNPSASDSNIPVGSGNISVRLPTFDNLELNLQEDVRVASEPLFSFRAQTEQPLKLTGDLENPLLDGTIVLTKGNVNLFTTQFNLARRSRNLAVFDPANGLDPTLKVELVTAVTEASRRRSSFDNTSSSEIIDQVDAGDFGSLQTVRVRANVEGPASTLLDNITLASSPSRTQGEILSLIGGGFVDTLGRGGDSTLALANLAGSALLGNIQSAINNALTGPVEVRLFPAVVESSKQKEQADNDDSAQSSVFALGAEVGVNINNNLSFSALKLLTVDLPAQFNLRYQLSDNLMLRATTDLQGENRAVVEYEARF